MPPEVEDADLIRRVADGSVAAFEELYRRHAPWISLRLGRRCADPALVDEVVQDTFVAVWKGARRYDGSGAAPAWLWGIAIRRLIDAFRRRPPATNVLAPWMDELTVSESAEDRVLVGVQHGDLAGALQRLAPELRAVICATVLDGLTTREAGRLLGIPAGTVKTRMMRARQQLRKELA